MNDVPLIKKGVFKSYLKNAVSNGAVMGVIFFGILWGKELHWTKALWIGFSSGFALFFIVQMLAFLNNEVLERKKKIKKLKSFKCILNKGFKITDDLYYEGLTDNYFVQIFLIEEWISPYKKKKEYVNVRIYYDFPKALDMNYLINEIKNLKQVADISIKESVITFLPVHYKLNDSVLDAITEVVEFLKKLQMKPISYDEWKTKYKNLDNRMNKINKKPFNLLKNVYKLNKPNTKG